MTPEPHGLVEHFAHRLYDVSRTEYPMTYVACEREVEAIVAALAKSAAARNDDTSGQTGGDALATRLRAYVKLVHPTAHYCACADIEAAAVRLEQGGAG